MEVLVLDVGEVVVEIWMFGEPRLDVVVGKLIVLFGDARRNRNVVRTMAALVVVVS